MCWAYCWVNFQCALLLCSYDSPYLLCILMINSSSSLLQLPLTTAGLRVLIYRSWHCLPVLPSNRFAQVLYLIVPSLLPTGSGWYLQLMPTGPSSPQVWVSCSIYASTEQLTPTSSAIKFQFLALWILAACLRASSSSGAYFSWLKSLFIIR